MSSAKFSIMINGLPRGYCQAHRGLCQGDPLLAFVFSIVGEALSKMLSVAREAHLISGFIPAANAPMIAHLQFADDTIIF